jgi:hydroxymethylglutaryl-CoA synthase
MRVGIDRFAVYVPQYALRLGDLAVARGVPPEKLTAGLGVREMAIAAPCEDVVTLAATAGARLLRAAQVDPAEIGMLLVATETGVDHSKPVSIFVHDLLGIGPRCRVYELKHACYAGTAALMTAADWVRAAPGHTRQALVIAADIARYEIGSPGEPTQGAGAVAMLVRPPRGDRRRQVLGRLLPRCAHGRVRGLPRARAARARA